MQIAATIPPRTDVVVIGSGYTGLHAALELARGGREVLVLEAGAAGAGCSTRNGGVVSTSIKPGFDELARKYGAERARSILLEGHTSLAFLRDFIASEQIACDLSVSGRIHAAHSPAAYERLGRAFERQPRELRQPGYVFSRAEQRKEVGTDLYHGGVVYTENLSLDPARYHRGVLDRALAAGVAVATDAKAVSIDRDGDGFTVRTATAAITCRNVVVATDGYTGRVVPWFRRRIIPIGSYVIATERIPAELASAILPTGRGVTDTRKLVYYYRLAPDRSRVIFGGRVSWTEAGPDVSARLLKTELDRLFPSLASFRVSHSWMGYVGYTFDTLAHLGERNGIHYALGYCGSGVAMSSYFGMKIGRRILGQPGSGTAFDGLALQGRPYYTGYPWFLAPSVAYYRWKDAHG